MQRYYKKIILNQNKIRNDEITVEQFAEFLPTVTDMFTICKDLASGELEGFQMPKHIQDVIDFLSQESEEVL